MRQLRRWGVLGLGVASVVAALAATASACVPVATLSLSPASARPGEEVAVTGKFYNAKNPVVLRFNSLDGPVLATLQASQDRVIEGRVTIPADAKPGNYTVIATQDADPTRTTWGIPSRALVTVVGEGGAPVVAPPVQPVAAGRPAGLARVDTATAGELALVGLGVAGVAMFLAGVAAFFAARRPETQAARASR